MYLHKIRIFKLICFGLNFQRSMTNSQINHEYVKKFRKDDVCLPNSWIVVRLDGRGFSRFTELHSFHKPNDLRALELMNRAAARVMEQLADVCLAFGQSDEYSFVLKKNTEVFGRSRNSIMTVVNSIFAAAYVYHWNDYFAYTKLLYTPGFDCRVVVYPSDDNLRDYLNWRQADVHINNLYNTAFWALVLKGKYDKRKAQEILRGTVSSQKNDILFNDYGINYNNEPQIFRKGSTLIRKLALNPSSLALQQVILFLNCDIIGNQFWKEHPEILGLQNLEEYNLTCGMKHYYIDQCNVFREKNLDECLGADVH